jgi:uncharacterized protein YdeI (BOF family)
MRKAVIAAVGIAPLIAASAIAQDRGQQNEQPNPYMRADNTWISIDGTVETVLSNSFALDYGPGTITVEMDDSDRDAEGYNLRTGDQVRVSGRVDNELFARTTIEASSVYVENLGTYFFASSADEEDRALTNTWPLQVSSTTLRGTVKDVGEESFTVSSPGGAIKVETDRLAYDPLDGAGYQRIESGDVVMVTGHMDTEFFDAQRELQARSVVVLHESDDRSGRSQASNRRDTRDDPKSGEDRERVVQSEEGGYR